MLLTQSSLQKEGTVQNNRTLMRRYKCCMKIFCQHHSSYIFFGSDTTQVTTVCVDHQKIS